jgi:hypothetical protein
MIAMSRIDFGKKLRVALESNNNVQADPVATPAAEPVVPATESTPAAEPAAVPAGTTPAQEGEFSNAIVGAYAGVNPITGALHGAYRGHQIEELHKQLKEVDAEIAKTKADIAEHHRQHHAATEGLLGAAGGAVVGGVSSLASPIAGIGAGSAIGSSAAATEKLLSQKRAILASLKKKHVELLKAAHEALGGGQADLQSLIAAAESALNEDDVPATESAPAEPAAAEPVVASTESDTAAAPAPAPAAAPAAEPATSTTESEGVIAAPQGGTETIETDEAPHRVEDHLINADACGDVMAAHLKDAHKLHKAVIDLESLMDVVHVEPNGINQAEAKYVTLAVEHITSEFAGDIKLVPSVEAFGGPVSRQEATLTLEANIAEVGKQIMAHLKELWGKFMAALKSMWEHLFGAASVLERDAGKLEARANALQGEPREKTIDLGPLAHRVAIGDKVPTSLKDVLSFMKLGELKTAAEKALDESEISAAIQKMVDGGDIKDHALGASVRENLKVISIVGHELPGGVKYVLGANGNVEREIADTHVASTEIPVLGRVELIHLAHEAGALAREAAAVLKDIGAATSKDAGQFIDTVKIEDEYRAHAIAHAIHSIVAERKQGLKLVADAITDYLKAAQALVAIGNKCAAKYGEAGIVEKAGDAAKAAADAVKDAGQKAGTAVQDAVQGTAAVRQAAQADLGGGAAPAPAAAAAA